MTRRLVFVGIALFLIVGVSWVAIDGFRRANSVSVLSNSVENPPPEATAIAERNLSYLVGLMAGFASGMAAMVIIYLLVRVAVDTVSASRHGKIR